MIYKVWKFHENLTTNADCIEYTNAHFQLKMASFPLLIIFKINKAEVIDKMDQLCKSHENLAKNRPKM